MGQGTGTDGKNRRTPTRGSKSSPNANVVAGSTKAEQRKERKFRARGHFDQMREREKAGTFPKRDWVSYRTHRERVHGSGEKRGKWELGAKQGFLRGDCSETHDIGSTKTRDGLGTRVTYGHGVVQLGTKNLNKGIRKIESWSLRLESILRIVHCLGLKTAGKFHASSREARR